MSRALLVALDRWVTKHRAPPASQVPRIDEGTLVAPSQYLTGMTVRLKTTLAERLAAGDPRPSLQELYVTHEGYVDAIARPARDLAQQRFMLQEDVDKTIAEAVASDVLW